MDTVLLLDLDHTLVHSHETRVNGFPTYDVTIGKFTYVVHVRPHVLDFLRFLLDKKMRFGFWTAGTHTYAHAVLNGLFDLLSVSDWRERVCTVRSRASARKVRGQYVKNLDVVRRSLKTRSLLLIDDDPVHRTLPQNDDSILTIHPFDVRYRLAANDRLFERLRTAMETFHKKNV